MPGCYIVEELLLLLLSPLELLLPHLVPAWVNLNLCAAVGVLLADVVAQQCHFARLL
jgi:hypothetical protein